MKNIIQDIKKMLYFKKLQTLFNKALNEGKITEFEETIFEKMSDTIIACLPVSLYIKYSNLLFADGTCNDRSLYMFLALDDALLVRGNHKDLEYKYGECNEEHWWVEIGNYVYDPSLMLKFDKETYYTLYGCSKVSKTDKETYLQQHKKFVDTHVTHDFNEFRPNGKRRLELETLIFQIKILSQMINNEQFDKDLNAYLTLIEYDENQIYEERQRTMQRILSNKDSMSIVSGKTQ